MKLDVLILCLNPSNLKREPESIDPEATRYLKHTVVDLIDLLKVSTISTMKNGFQINPDDSNFSTMIFLLPSLDAGWHYQTTEDPIAAMQQRPLVFLSLILTFYLSFAILIHTHIARVLNANFKALLEMCQIFRNKFTRRAAGEARFTCEAHGHLVASELLDIDNTTP
jgi:hypothetical protein